MLTVIGCRDEAVISLPPGLQRLVEESGRQLALGGLDDAALSALSVAVRREGLTGPAARRLGRHTDGNPLHAVALLQELGTDQLEGHPGESLPAPRSFAKLVAGRMVRCSSETRALVAAMAVLGRHCRLDHATEVSGVNDALACLDEASTARLLSVWQPGEDVVFAHWLVRAAVYFDLSASHRSRLHARAAEVVDTEDEVLHHRVAASASGDAALASEAATLAVGE